MRKIIIGSRGSDLALWQANFVRDELEKLGHQVEITIIKTQGDKIQNLSFDKLEGKGFFTKEIEDALLNKTIDIAVHSHKDLETNPPEGLSIAAVSSRANPEDLLLFRKSFKDSSKKWQLSEGAIVGTSSARRKSQLLALRGDLKVQDLRGNVPTRIEKLRNGEYDAILLARAGVERLNLDVSDLETVILDPQEFVPAPAQGVLGLQIRSEDNELAEILQNLNDSKIQERIILERKVLNLMEGGCQLPLGVYWDHDDVLYVSYSNTTNQTERILVKYNALEITAQEIVTELNAYGKQEA